MLTENLKNKMEELYQETPESVTSVSFGFKYKNNQKTNILSVCFGVDKKLPLTEISPEDVLPNTVIVDGVRYPTDVTEVKKASYHTCWESGSPEILRLQGNPNLLKPFRGGQQIIQYPTNWTYSAPSWYFYVGTLGFFAVDNIDNKVVGVTNSHVVCANRLFANERNIDSENVDPYNTVDELTWSFNSGLYPPGALSLDGNILEISCPYIKRYQPVSESLPNYVDCALMIMNNATTNPYVSTDSYQIWQPIDTPDYTPYMPFATTSEIDNLLTTNPKLYSTGRTTGPKGYGGTPSCTLYATNVGANVDVEGQDWYDCVIYAYEDGSNYPSAGGDSGSAVIADFSGTRKIVGLLFAGSTTFSIFNRIDRVAQAMNIRAWDASYSLDKTYPPNMYGITASHTSPYASDATITYNGKTYYQVGYTLDETYPQI